jgi:hypothetical protein
VLADNALADYAFDVCTRDGIDSGRKNTSFEKVQYCLSASMPELCVHTGQCSELNHIGDLLWSVLRRSSRVYIVHDRLVGEVDSIWHSGFKVVASDNMPLIFNIEVAYML